MVPFFQICPALAKAETRSFALVAKDRAGIPKGEYGLVESYCTEPDCDCQRVMLTVLGRNSGQVEATISLGFNPDDEMSEPFLDPLNPQGAYAENLLGFVAAMVVEDVEYFERLKRHYAITKQIVAGQIRPQEAPASRVIQGQRLVDIHGLPAGTVNALHQPPSDIPAPQFMNRAERRRQEKADRRKRSRS